MLHRLAGVERRPGTVPEPCRNGICARQAICRRGKETAQFALNGTGSLDAVSLSALSIKTAKGGLAGKLNTGWKAPYDIGFEGRLDNFDPSDLYSGSSGAVNAAAETQCKAGKRQARQGALQHPAAGWPAARPRGRQEAPISDSMACRSPAKPISRPALRTCCSKAAMPRAWT